MRKAIQCASLLLSGLLLSFAWVDAKSPTAAGGIKKGKPASVTTAPLVQQHFSFLPPVYPSLLLISPALVKKPVPLSPALSIWKAETSVPQINNVYPDKQVGMQAIEAEQLRQLAADITSFITSELPTSTTLVLISPKHKQIQIIPMLETRLRQAGFALETIEHPSAEAVSLQVHVIRVTGGELLVQVAFKQIEATRLYTISTDHHLHALTPFTVYRGILHD
jgi:hypothetical protein